MNIAITMSKKNDDINGKKQNPSTTFKPPDVTLKCLVCKELVWIMSINTDFQVTQDLKSVTENNLVNLISNACQYPTWTLDYEFKYDVPKSEYYIDLLNNKRKNSDTWHDKYLINGCNFMYKNKAKIIAIEFMKYINNKQKLGNYVDKLQDLICGKLCETAKQGAFGSTKGSNKGRKAKGKETEKYNLTSYYYTMEDDNDEDEDFMEEEIDNWEDSSP